MSNEVDLEKVQEILANYWNQGSRHTLTLGTAALLATAGASEETAEALIEEICRDSGDDEIDDRRRCVADTYNRIRRNEPVSVKSFLEEALPQSAIESLVDALGLRKEYDYLDENGDLLFQVVRTDLGPKIKTFAVRHKDRQGNWVYNLTGCRVVPYNLPSVIEAVGKGEPIFIVEGEKCAEALIQQGFAATTNPFGAGRWRSDFNKYFQSADVIILPDNDDVGREHVQQVAESLLPVARQVRVVELPDLPVGGDIVDWIEAGHSIDEQHTLVDKAVPWKLRKGNREVVTTLTVNLDFPQEAAIGICADIARMFSEYFEAPFSFWFFAALTILGAVISGRVTLESEEKPQPRLYTVILGKSATARKSTAINHTVKFFTEALGEFMPHVEEGLGSGEGLGEVLQETGNCLVCLDELRVLVQKAKIENSTLLPLLTQLFHKNSFSNATRKRKLKITNGHLSLLAACTVETFEDMWDSEFTNIGFINRLWIVPDKPVKKIVLPRIIPDAVKKPLQEQLNPIVAEVFELSKGQLVIRAGNATRTVETVNPIQLKVSNEAYRMLQDYYINLPDSVYADRLGDAYVQRLAILLAVSSGNLTVIDAAVMEAAIRLAKWQFHVRKAYAPIDADNSVARVEQHIRRALLRNGGKMPLGRLANAVHSERCGQFVFEKALENLIKAEIIRKLPSDNRKGGRRTEVFELLEDVQ